jgi:hypothetical protein
MYNIYTNMATYESEYALISIDFDSGTMTGSLDPDLTRDEYEEIGFDLLNDDSYGDYLSWAMDYTPDGRGVVYIIGGDAERITLHPDGVSLTGEE